MEYSNSYLELNMQAYRGNIKFLRQMVGEGVEISSVVKGNAYGHGISQIVEMGLRCGIKHFSVFETAEAKAVFDVCGKRATIMIMGLVDEERMPWILENRIEFFVFDRERLTSAIRWAKKKKTKARIHLEVETGLNRTGFTTKQWPQIIELIRKEATHLEVAGLCTHYAGAENQANHLRVGKQTERFRQFEKELRSGGIEPEKLHTACSAASVIFPETRMDLVRIGILQYGLWPSQETRMHHMGLSRLRRDPLRRVISWKSRIMGIREVPPGEFVGYGNSFFSRQKMTMAVVPVGYSHGYSRSLSNMGRVLIKGSECGVIGNVNMNMMIVNVTGIKDVKKGDEVVLIGEQGEARVTVGSFSDFSNQLNYESLSRLPLFLERRIS